MCGKGLDAFFGRNRGSAFHTGDDHALGNIRQSVLQVQGTCCTAECADARAVIIRDFFLIQNVHLFTDRAVDAWVAGVEADCSLLLRFRFFDDFDDFFECHFGTVVDFAAFFCIGEKFRIYQRTCVDDYVCFLKIFFTSYCDKVRGSGTCSYEMYHFLFPPFVCLLLSVICLYELDK